MPDERTYGFNIDDASSLVATIGGTETEIPESRPSLSGGSIRYAFPPSGGIPAATYDATAEEMSPGVASCELASLVDGKYERSGDSKLVENPVGVVVGVSGKPMTIGKTSYGKWTVLVEDCTGTGGTGDPLTPTQDPISDQSNLGLEI